MLVRARPHARTKWFLDAVVGRLVWQASSQINPREFSAGRAYALRRGAPSLPPHHADGEDREQPAFVLRASLVSRDMLDALD